MDAQNNPMGDAPDTGIGKDNARWRPILLGLCVVGAGLGIGIVALQVTEYRFYQASPNVWPPRRPAAGQGATLPQTWQSGAGGTISAPAAPAATPAVPTTSTGLTPIPASTNAPIVTVP